MKLPCHVVLAFLVVGCSSETAPVEAEAPVRHNVSMYRLISNPQQFEGKRVTVVGYVLRTDFETSIVAVTEQDAYRFIGDNWIRLDAESCTYRDGKELTQGFAQISGTFSATLGEDRHYPGVIYDVVSCNAWTICRDGPNCT